MDPRAYRIAQEFLRAHLREARYAPEFLEWAGQRKFRNPETDNEVQFLSLPAPEQTRIYKQWAKSKGVQEQPSQPRKPETKEEITRRNLDIARNGEFVSGEILSTGGRGDSTGPGINQSYIVKLRGADGQEQVYIHKPAEGEEPHLRVGIPGGTYHAREAATYGLDRLIGGQGVVPATVSRGNGSYQVWAEGARAMHGDDLDELVGKVKPSELHRSPDFQRVNVLDLLSGHEDRHRGNLLYYFEGDKETPENLRFAAIDNGLTMAEPSDLPDHRAYHHPFGAFFVEDMDKPKHERQQDADVAYHEGEKAVRKTLSNIDPELHEQLKQVKLEDLAKTLTASGVKERGAVRAALVRLVALQSDPKIFAQMLDRSHGMLEKAWKEFQHLSGWKDDLLWRTDATDREPEITAAVEAATPEGGWTEPKKLDNFYAEAQKELDGFGNWGQESSEKERDIGELSTKRDVPEDLKTRKESALNVRDRWLSSALRRTMTRNGMPFPKRP